MKCTIYIESDTDPICGKHQTFELNANWKENVREFMGSFIDDLVKEFPQKFGSRFCPFIKSPSSNG